MFATSVITGKPVPGVNRIVAAAESPLTGTYGESEAGGFSAPELKYSGFDVVVAEEVSEKPVYLWIKDGRAEIRDATHLWG